ncbi:MAG: hypothetical protein ACREQ8_13315 [Woeseiaceae bacterium]
MKPAAILKEIAYPLADTVVLLALIVFACLSMLANAAGMLGIFLGILLIPALFHYLLLLLEARADGRSAPVAGIELFDIVENFWSLTPLVLYAAAVWGLILFANASILAGAAIALVLLAVLPASVAILAVTHSPLESLNPAALWRLVKACGPDYTAILVVLGLTVMLTSLAARANLPDVIVVVLSFYELFLLFTLTGGVLHANGVRFLIGIPDPVEVDDDVVASSRTKRRQQVLTHAYGFFSRNNRAGGLAHIQSAAQEEADPDDAYLWYFRQMLEWESQESALLLGQAYLGRLLEREQELEALKLMTRCVQVDPAFRPLPGDRPAALAAAERCRREDLLKNLV